MKKIIIIGIVVLAITSVIQAYLLYQTNKKADVALYNTAVIADFLNQALKQATSTQP